MQEVRSLPSPRVRIWADIVFVILLVMSATATLLSTEVVYLCAGLSAFAGWILLLDVKQSKTKLAIMGVLIGSISSCAIDAITFGVALQERGLANIVWNKILIYIASAFVGLTLSLCRIKKHPD